MQGLQRRTPLPLIDEQRGIAQAMRKLGLDAVGLTAPRLSPDTRPPQNLVGKLDCRGGPSYASTAVLRSLALAQTSAVRQDVGGDRRLWVDVLLDSGVPLHWVTLVLPPEGRARDDEWVQELEGLTRDIQLLKTSSQSQEPLFLCMGDFNMQPDDVGSRPEISRIRQRAWADFLTFSESCVFNSVFFA